MAQRTKIPGVDAKLLIKDAAKLLPEPSRRFFLRAEFRNHEIFTSRDSNEVKKEWKVGFAFFY